MIGPPQHRRCSRCGYPLGADSITMGLCPRCLLTRVLDVRHNMHMQLDRIQPWPDAPTPGALQAAMPGLEVLELMAHGGMGLVYRARQKDLQREVALKILPIDAVQDATVPARFQTEARILAELDHPHIVMAIEAGQTRDWLYLVMELVSGPTLRAVLKHQQKLAPRHALTIAAQISSALSYAHARQIIHRDIKPDNILLDPGNRPADADLDAFFAKGGRVRVADFGIAKSLHHAAQDMTLTGPDQLFGTADYIAPECRQAGHAPGPASDVYALGVVLYEMLSGHVPAGHFPPPSRVAPVSRKVDAIVLRCLAADPSQRYASANELRHQIIRVLTTRRAPDALLVSGSALLAAAAVAVTVAFLDRSGPRPMPATLPVLAAPQPKVEAPATRPSASVLVPVDRADSRPLPATIPVLSSPQAKVEAPATHPSASAPITGDRFDSRPMRVAIPVLSSPQPKVEPPATHPSVSVLMPGDTIRVKWGEQWYDATVVRREGRRVLVHFDGWSNNFDQWVGSDRLKW